MSEKIQNLSQISSSKKKNKNMYTGSLFRLIRKVLTAYVGSELSMHRVLHDCYCYWLGGSARPRENSGSLKFTGQNTQNLQRHLHVPGLQFVRETSLFLLRLPCFAAEVTLNQHVCVCV